MRPPVSAWLTTRVVLACALGCCLHVHGQQRPVGKEVVYKTAADTPLHLYISSPAPGPVPDTKLHAAIVFYHGGAWTMGQLWQFNKQSTYLASRGMVAVQVEYRLLGKDTSDPPRICVEDAKSAMRWVRAHAAELHVDPNRIVAAGASAGGYLAAYDALLPGWDDPADDLKVSPIPNALVLLFPVVDVGPTGFGMRRFGPTYAERSPTEHLADPDRKLPPTLIQGGTADKLVHPQVLRDFKAKAEKAGYRCELIFYDDQPHGFSNAEPYTTITLNAAAKFLDSLGYLTPGPAAVDPVPAAAKPMDAPTP